MFLDIEIISGFYPLQIFASIDVLIVDQKVHAESAIAIFVFCITDKLQRKQCGSELCSETPKT